MISIAEPCWGYMCNNITCKNQKTLHLHTASIQLLRRKRPQRFSEVGPEVTNIKIKESLIRLIARKLDSLHSIEVGKMNSTCQGTSTKMPWPTQRVVVSVCKLNGCVLMLALGYQLAELGSDVERIFRKGWECVHKCASPRLSNNSELNLDFERICFDFI